MFVKMERNLKEHGLHRKLVITRKNCSCSEKENNTFQAVAENRETSMKHITRNTGEPKFTARFILTKPNGMLVHSEFAMVLKIELNAI